MTFAFIFQYLKRPFIYLAKNMVLSYIIYTNLNNLFYNFILIDNFLIYFKSVLYILSEFNENISFILSNILYKIIYKNVFLSCVYVSLNTYLNT